MANGRHPPVVVPSHVHDDPRFAPFARNDRYGTEGLAPQPASETARLVLMTIFVVPIRVVLALLCLVSCYLCARLSDYLPQAWRNPFCQATAKFWCNSCARCFSFNIKWVKVSGGPGSSVKAAGIVSNHCSYMDILLHLGRNFPSFAAREGTQQLPFIGYISQKIQCIYVTRGKKDAPKEGAQGVSAMVKARMEALIKDPNSEDRPMLLFPEGTTTNGKFLLPFKTGAFLAGMPLQPIIIKYDDKDFSPCWDTIDIRRHIWLCLCRTITTVTCYELPVYVPSEEERANAALYADNMRNYMLKYGKMQASHPLASFESKMEYHGILEGKFKYTGPAQAQAKATERADGKATVDARAM